MIHRSILYFGQPCVVACDATCGKAWGIQNRPMVVFGDRDDDDFAYLADDEIGAAPVDPGTYEGVDGKPVMPSQRLNRWCVRECERSKIADTLAAITLHDFSERLYNQPWKHLEPTP